MERKTTPERQLLTVLAVYLAVILVSLLLVLCGQVAGWIGQLAISAAVARIFFLFGWGMAANGKGWRV